MWPWVDGAVRLWGLGLMEPGADGGLGRCGRGSMSPRTDEALGRCGVGLMWPWVDGALGRCGRVTMATRPLADGAVRLWVGRLMGPWVSGIRPSPPLGDGALGG